jgi:hypothetical protein
MGADGSEFTGTSQTLACRLGVLPAAPSPPRCSFVRTLKKYENWA